MTVESSTTISDAAKVRFSRDGDQFHYLWAARRCLRLLLQSSDLVAVAIEGASVMETGGDPVEGGAEIIDISEYRHSENLDSGGEVVYMQLKHSTQNAAVPWPPSGLRPAIEGFSKRFLALEKKFGDGSTSSRVQFWFVSNRPINVEFVEAVADARNKQPPRHPKELQKLETYTSLEGDRLAAFCALLRFEGEQAGYLEQRVALGQEARSYLTGNDVDAPIRLKDLVTRRATSEGTEDPAIRRLDVLRAFQVTEDEIFPAPSLLPSSDESIPRTQEADIREVVISAAEPVLLHAAGGVGKSVLAQRLSSAMPPGSASVIYDCFANGAYRRVAGYRHRHKHGLVQIANELSAKGLCDPLIPFAGSDSTQFVHAFRHRLGQAVASVRASNSDALVAILIDAADNAEIIARELGDGPSFSRELLREPVIPGVRLVVICRTERQELLDPPSSVIRVELKTFERAETAQLLRRAFPQAVEPDIDEFHRLTSQNPRVQATVLSQGGELPTVLKSLGPNPTTVDDTLAKLLESAVAHLIDNAGVIEKAQITSLCSSLSVLRPFVPIAVLAELASVHEAAVRSFVADLGRPLLVTDDAVQFRDEPTETWFRKNYRPAGGDMVKFLEVLIPLASSSSYVASSIPQLMLEAGQLADLVSLALSGDALPTDKPVERREIELQRLLFALKASLRAKGYKDAAKLALKAAQESVGDNRQSKLFQDNTDLPVHFFEAERIAEIIARRPFSETWLGGHYAHQAAMLSTLPDHIGDARSHLRMAYDWLSNWARQPQEQRDQERIETDDIASLAYAELLIHGPTGCLEALKRWRPKDTSYRAGLELARRLIDAGKYLELEVLADAASRDFYLVLAITHELRRVNHYPPKASVERVLNLVRRRRIRTESSFEYRSTPILSGVVALIESAAHYQIAGQAELAAILRRYLPKDPPYGIAHDYGNDREILLRAYCLHSTLAGSKLSAPDLAPPHIRKELDEKGRHSDSGEARKFKDAMAILLPWHELRSRQLVAEPALQDVRTAITDISERTLRATRFSHTDDSWLLENEVAEIWFDILASAPSAGDDLLAAFRKWIADLHRPLFTLTLARLARVAARSQSLAKEAYEFAGYAVDINRSAQEDAESRAQTYVELCRAMLSLDRNEAEEMFKAALEVVGKLGDEVVERWLAILDLADRACDATHDNPRTAYRLARCAEVVQTYNTKHFDWAGTVNAIAGLSPRSSLATLSRWRDRAFGSFEELLPVVVRRLMSDQHLDPVLAVSLAPFNAEWDHSELLSAVLSTDVRTSERERAVGVLLHYMRLNCDSQSQWISVIEALRSSGIQVPDLDTMMRGKPAKNEDPVSSQDAFGFSPAVKKETIDWSQIFEGVDVTSDSQLGSAYRRFEASKAYARSLFFQEAVSRTKTGEEPQFIRTFAASAQFDLYDLRALLDVIPEAWKTRLGIQAAVREALRTACSRHAMQISRSRYHTLFPIQTVPPWIGISDFELADIALASMSRSTETMDSSRLFSLIGLLSPMLTNVEALESLNSGLDLIEAVLADEDGDGPWSDALMPPVTLDRCIASLIYVGLAAPKSAYRWEAAHAVRALYSLGMPTIADHVVELAVAGRPGPFVDSRLFFYQIHAQQWLLLTLARVALDSPGLLEKHLHYLTQCAKEAHVIIRHYAAQAAITIASATKHELPSDVGSRLTAVNASRFPVIHRKRQWPPDRGPIEQTPAEKKFSFAYDMDNYWFEPLASCFGMHSEEAQDVARAVITKDWGMLDPGGREADERIRRGTFRERETWHSHDSYPRTDDLRFYLSYHSLMVTAGKLLDNRPLQQDADSEEDQFKEWLHDHLITRSDGRWLSDRRDPVPAEIDDWSRGDMCKNWRWSLNRGEFNRVLGASFGRVSVWGNWKSGIGSYEESVEISSALVGPERADALLRATQTAKNKQYFGLPTAEDGDDSDISAEPFELKAWLDASIVDPGIDRFDPWSGSVRYPAPAPAPFVQSLMSLASDFEKRVWFAMTNPGHQEDLLWADVWGDNLQDHDHTDMGRQHGVRLVVSPHFLKELLSRTGMVMIIKVAVDRTIRPFSDERSASTDEYLPTSFRMFLYDRNGIWRTI